MTGGCKKQQESRKEAYHYIVLQAKGIPWSPPIDSDERLAEVLDIPIDELISLKEGRSDPSPKLVANFKKLFGSWIKDDDQIEAYLDSPFLTKP